METAEKILREYVEFDDVNGSKAVKLLPLTIIDAMIEYASEACREQRGLCWRNVKIVYKKLPGLPGLVPDATNILEAPEPELK